MTMKCNEVQELLAPYADGVLVDDEKQLAEAHISHCPSCRLRVESKQGIAIALRSLNRSQRAAVPADRVLRDIRTQWNLIDARPRRQLRLQFASIAALVLICTFGMVWARLAVDRSFPASFIVQDYTKVNSAPLVPAYTTNDPAAAAKWLRSHLHAAVPPVNLSLCNAHLVGASVVRLHGTLSGRLVYHTPAGMAAVYVVPGKTAFRSLAQSQTDGNNFYSITQPGAPGLFAWSYNGLGYGVADASPTEADSCAVAAQRSTSMP
jgi:anti-sigma factor RsiW